MKKITLRAVVALCLCVALIGGGLSVYSLANDAATVTYDHALRQFRFLNIPCQDGHEHRYPDLFPNMKDLMPGDSVTQSITVDVENLSGGTVYLYLRTDDTAESGATAEELAAYQTLLESGHVSLVVRQNGRILSEQSLKDGVLLGKFRSFSDPVEVDVEFSVDKEAANDLMGLRAGIGWIFTAEWFPDPDEPVGPPMGAQTDHYGYIVGYPDGLVHPERNITRAETVTIFFRMLTDELREAYWSRVNPYPDVRPEEWFNNAISTMHRYGILKGYPDGSFMPNANITRAEFAALAVRFFEGEGEPGEGDAFPDIKRHWANAEINLAYAKGLVEGYPDGTFKPDQIITRAEAMTIVNRVLHRYPHKEHLLEDMITWPDNMDTEMWYYETVQEATNSHLYRMEGDHEVWTELLPVRDWAALERLWSEHNSSESPGEVVSSRGNSIFKN